MPVPQYGKKFIFASFIAPMFVFIVAACVIANILIFKDLKSIAKHYVVEVDQIIEDRIRENQLALKNKKHCSWIQQKLLFEGAVRELLIVEDQVSICSSKLGEQAQDVQRYVPPRDIVPGQYLFDVTGEPDSRTLVVVSSLPDSPRTGAFSVIDRNYIAARMMKELNGTIDQVYGRFGNKTYPAEIDPIDSYFKTVKSKEYNYSVTVETKQSYVISQYVLMILSSIPLSLFVSFVFILASRRLKNQNSMVDDIKRGLARGEFFMVYQPLVNPNSTHKNNVGGMEALIRWQHPTIGLVRPDVFIPLAEQHGLINRLTDYVFGQVINDLNGLDIESSEAFHIGVNVPPSYLASKNCMEKLEQYAQCFAETQWIPTIEVTERQLLDKESQQVLKKAREMGFKVSIDDFGTGHTSLAVLQNIEFDYLKIDKCFVDTVGVDTVSAPVLLTIIELAHKLKVEIVAEGVETEKQQQFLQSHNCQYLQGYYFYRPLPLAELEQTL